MEPHYHLFDTDLIAAIENRDIDLGDLRHILGGKIDYTEDICNTLTKLLRDKNLLIEDHVTLQLLALFAYSNLDIRRIMLILIKRVLKKHNLFEDYRHICYMLYKDKTYNQIYTTVKAQRLYVYMKDIEDKTNNIELNYLHILIMYMSNGYKVNPIIKNHAHIYNSVTCHNRIEDHLNVLLSSVIAVTDHNDGLDEMKDASLLYLIIHLIKTSAPMSNINTINLRTCLASLTFDRFVHKQNAKTIWSDILSIYGTLGITMKEMVYGQYNRR